jgi:hypothetical protein
MPDTEQGIMNDEGQRPCHAVPSAFDIHYSPSLFRRSFGVRYSAFDIYYSPSLFRRPFGVRYSVFDIHYSPSLLCRSFGVRYSLFAVSSLALLPQCCFLAL